MFESMVPLEERWADAYRHRATAIGGATKKEKDEAIDALRQMRDRLSALVRVLKDEISSATADVSKNDLRVSSVDPSDPNFPLVNEQRALLAEKIGLLRELEEAAAQRLRVLRRWVKQLDPEESEQTLGSAISKAATDAWGFIGKVWAFELTHFEEEVVVDGQKITGRMALTLGMVLRALVFFAVAFWIASRFADRIEAMLVTRRRMEEAHARTLRNWTMIAVGVLLVLATLAFLKIPLTVFALLGGALAIGLGFGTQTLIKNFISGIIVLIERKVRVGDLLDVEGIVGRVVEVNARSSVIRSADDVETMIPNSMFLENRFTNWTLSTSRIRRAIRVGVAYGTSPRQVIQAIGEEATRHGLVCKEPEPLVVFEDFGDSALMFCLYYWFDLQSGSSPLVVDSDLRIMIEKRLSEMKIGIPFPQRDVHLSPGPLEVRIARDDGGEAPTSSER